MALDSNPIGSGNLGVVGAVAVHQQLRMWKSKRLKCMQVYAKSRDGGKDLGEGDTSRDLSKVVIGWPEVRAEVICLIGPVTTAKLAS